MLIDLNKIQIQKSKIYKIKRKYSEIYLDKTYTNVLLRDSFEFAK